MTGLGEQGVSVTCVVNTAERSVDWILVDAASIVKEVDGDERRRVEMPALCGRITIFVDWGKEVLPYVGRLCREGVEVAARAVSACAAGWRLADGDGHVESLCLLWTLCYNVVSCKQCVCFAADFCADCEEATRKGVLPNRFLLDGRAGGRAAFRAREWWMDDRWTDKTISMQRSG